MTDFTIGQNLFHPVHGACTVTFVGEDYVGIELDGGQQVLVKKEAFTKMPPYAEEINHEARPSTWPESTFILEGPEVKHYPASHWDAFYDDPQPIVKKLPEIVKSAELWIGGVNRETPHSLPEQWTQGKVLAWPNHRQGIMTVLRKGNPNSLEDIYPFITDSGQHTLIIRRVNVWDNGVEAQIEAEFENSEITFFDIAYMKHRLWYEAGKSYEFILSGIAYAAQPAKIMEMKIKHNPDDIAWQKLLAERSGNPAPDEHSILNLRGMAMFMPIDEWDADDYRFRGPVKSVREIDSDIFGQQGWFVNVSVMRFGGQDINLDILITGRAWQTSGPPCVGQDIEGSLWLQGYLWHI